MFQGYQLQVKTLDKTYNRTDSYTKKFDSITLHIFPKVYSAGADSRLLFDNIAVLPNERVLDLCTGTGLIALRAKQLGSPEVVAVDINPEAIKNTIHNSKKNKLPITTKQGDLFAPVRGRRFDVVTINPPFSNHPAQNAVEKIFWDENYTLIKKFFGQLHKHLLPHGRAYLAWSEFGDNRLLRNLAYKHGFDIKLIASKKGKSNFIFYVYEIRYQGDCINLREHPFGKSIQIYDVTNKLGDWIFKKPIMYSLHRCGYKVAYRPRSIPSHYPVESFFRQSSAPSSLAMVLTRSDRRLGIKNIISKHEAVIEICRTSRDSGCCRIWVNGRLSVKKVFCIQSEEAHIRQVVQVLGLEYFVPTVSPITSSKVHTMVCSFNVGENIDARTNFHILSIEQVIQEALHMGFSIRYLKQTDADDIVWQKLSDQIKSNIKVVHTPNIEHAMSIVRGSHYFFGADSGLAHYAVSKGRIVFALFTRKYHGTRPIFASQHINHLWFFGDKTFASECIFYLRNSLPGETNTYLYEFIEKTRRAEFVPSNDAIKNDNKFPKLIFDLIKQSPEFNQKHKLVSSWQRGLIVPPDSFLETNYTDIKPLTGPLFINSRKFVRDLEKTLKKFSNATWLRHVNVWAKNSSLFYGTMLRRGISDIDFMTIENKEKNKKVNGRLLQEIIGLMRQYNLSLDLPHQAPAIRYIKTSTHDLKSFIIAHGSNAWQLAIPTDAMNIEKYKARIKLKLILGEMNKSDLRHLKKYWLESPLFGQKFIREIDLLLQDSSVYPDCKRFIRKIEAAIAQVGGYGSASHIIINIDKASEYKVVSALKALMYNGIIHISGTSLYVNWDLRRPYHGWHIPVHLQFESGQDVCSDVVRYAHTSPIYGYDNFKILKTLQLARKPIKLAPKLLCSGSFLVTAEAFRHIIKYSSSYRSWFTSSAVREFVESQNSNADSGLEKQISLLGLAVPKGLLSSSVQIDQLSKYNLFVFATNTIDAFVIENSSFYKINKDCSYISSSAISMGLVDVYKRKIITLLREYYLYTIVGSSQDIQNKRKELLLTYIVQGRSLLEGPPKQSRAIKQFLTSIPITDVLQDQTSLINTLRLFKSLPPLHRSTKIEHSLGYIIRQSSNHANLLKGAKDVMKQKTLLSNAEFVLQSLNWDVWKRTPQYEKLLAHIKFRGAFLLTDSCRKKYPIFYWYSQHGPVMVLRSSVAKKFGIKSVHTIGLWTISTPTQFIYDRTLVLEYVPSSALSSFTELRLGATFFGNKGEAFKVIENVGEGNFSVAYKIEHKRHNFVVKCSYLSTQGEFKQGQSLHQTSSNFVEYFGYDPYTNLTVSQYINGSALAHNKKKITQKQINLIKESIFKIYVSGVAYGDLTTRNILIDNKSKLWFIDNHFFYPPQISFLKDLLGLYTLILYPKTPNVWDIRNRIINGDIKDVSKLLNILIRLGANQTQLRNLQQELIGVLPHLPNNIYPR